MRIEVVEIIVFSTIALFIVLNIILNINKYKNDTINVVIKNWSLHNYYFITFLWGVFGGHFFLGTKEPIHSIFLDHWEIPPILLAVIVIIMLLHGRKLPKDYIVGIRNQITLILSGVLFGHFIWSQRHEEFIKFTLNI